MPDLSKTRGGRGRSSPKLGAGLAPPKPVRPLARVVSLLTRRPADDLSATRTLAHDHQVVRALFGKLEDEEARGGRSRRDIVDQIRRELDVHTRITERVFLPACRVIPDAHVRRFVAESTEEHRIVTRLIREIGALSPLDERYEAKVAVLTRFVVRQTAEEERDLFAEVDRALPGTSLEALGVRLRQLRARLSDGP